MSSICKNVFVSVLLQHPLFPNNVAKPVSRKVLSFIVVINACGCWLQHPSTISWPESCCRCLSVSCAGFLNLQCTSSCCRRCIKGLTMPDAIETVPSESPKAKSISTQKCFCWNGSFASASPNRSSYCIFVSNCRCLGPSLSDTKHIWVFSSLVMQRLHRLCADSWRLRCKQVFALSV